VKHTKASISYYLRRDVEPTVFVRSEKEIPLRLEICIPSGEADDPYDLPSPACRAAIYGAAAKPEFVAWRSAQYDKFAAYLNERGVETKPSFDAMNPGCVAIAFLKEVRP